MNRSRGLGGFVFIFGDDSLGSVFTMYVLIKRDWFRNTQCFLSRGRRIYLFSGQSSFPPDISLLYMPHLLFSYLHRRSNALMGLSMMQKSQPFTRANMILAKYMYKESRARPNHPSCSSYEDVQ